MEGAVHTAGGVGVEMTARSKVGMMLSAEPKGVMMSTVQTEGRVKYPAKQGGEVWSKAELGGGVMSEVEQAGVEMSEAEATNVIVEVDGAMVESGCRATSKAREEYSMFFYVRRDTGRHMAGSLSTG